MIRVKDFAFSYFLNDFKSDLNFSNYKPNNCVMDTSKYKHKNGIEL